MTYHEIFNALDQGRAVYYGNQDHPVVIANQGSNHRMLAITYVRNPHCLQKIHHTDFEADYDGSHFFCGGES